MESFSKETLPTKLPAIKGVENEVVSFDSLEFPEIKIKPATTAIAKITTAAIIIIFLFSIIKLHIIKFYLIILYNLFYIILQKLKLY